MPLPTASQVWPPRDFSPIAVKYAEHSAWYAGDPQQLRDTYQRGTPARLDRPSQYRGGAGGALARMWWGRPIGDLTKRHDSLHVPLASDICQASADLLYSEPPSFTSEHAATQSHLDNLAENGLLTTLAESAELVAALGGGYQRVTWAADSGRDSAFITNVDADGAYPTFRWGQLVAVTFWWEVGSNASTVWRHLEHHELDATGIGVIFHGLYEGTVDNLGRAIPLAEQSATSGLAAVVDDESKVSTLTPGLAVEYFPNQLPQRLLRKHPIGRNLGRSDLAGIEPLMDSIDETYSSWMRDIRLAKSRLIVPQHMLQSAGRGQGAMLDLDQDVFVGLNQPPTADGTGELTENQFKIRNEEHEATIVALVKAALRTAGYSGETFGEDNGGGMKTATEVVAEQTRSYMTRDRKIRILKPRQLRILRKLVAVDQAVYSRGLDSDKVGMDFADAVQADPESLARTAQSLRTAQAASTKTLVAMQHPDWDGKAIDAEVALILSESRVQVDLPPMPGDEPPAPVAEQA
jgi:A118 family predicted phage portal protein